ncbi:MAG: MMPL family transporter [Sphaerochaetaceae bacterium]|nr:MMPL family transporter [Sphaerochaetaceae bacterium]
MKKQKSTICRILPFLLYHIAVVLCAVVCCMISARRVRTDFTDIIPSRNTNKAVSAAEKKFTENQNANVNIFIGCADFDRAETAARELFSILDGQGIFSELTLENESVSADAVKDFINSNVYLLLDDETQEKIKANPSAFQEESLATIFSAMTLSDLGNLENDPFLLSESVWRSFLNEISDATSLSPRNNLLCSEADGIWYIMMSGKLTNKNIAVTDRNGGIRSIYAAGDSIAEKYGDVSVNYSGIPFHSWEGANSSQKEITLISAFSIIAVLVMFLIVCRNLHILKLFIVSLLLATVSAAGCLVIFFREFNVMTLIFGTTLIGTCIDYAIHFYTRYTHKQDGENTWDIRKKLVKSLSVSFLSTELCYALLLLSEYPVLRQIAVFSCGGLLSSYLTTLFLYPNMISEKDINRKSFIAKQDKKTEVPFLLPVLAVLSTVLLAVNLPNVKIHNDITSLYVPSPRLLDGETVAAKVLGYSSVSYAVIGGSSEEDVLQNESRFTAELKKQQNEGKLKCCIACSSFIPSVSQQEKSIEAAKLLIPNKEKQCNILGIDSVEKVTEVIENLQPSLTISDLPPQLSSLVSGLVIGEIENIRYNAVLIQNAENEDEIAEIAAGYPDVTYFRTATDISRSLDILTRRICILSGIAFAVIAVLLVAVLGLSKGVKMLLAPYTIACLTIAVTSFSGMYIDFFFITGMILTLGLGLDYIVFAYDKGRGTSFKAVLFSFITTELSFGTLVFSSFRPVHIFGVTVFTGIFAAYLCALTSGRKEEK